MLDNKQITVTSGVLEALLENNCAVITCDSKSMPVGLMLPLYGNTTQNERFRHQLDSSLPLKKQLWQQTIKVKIENQAAVLKKCTGEEIRCMKMWASEVKSGDSENMEARAAAYYWKYLFPIDGFTRGRDGIPPNNLLNYGYAILRAVVARGLVSSGLLPTLGIHHHNRYNAYCLADDLMEPFRTVVDKAVYTLNPENKYIEELTQDMRRNLISTLQGKLNTANGMWKISDLIQRSAQQTADSFQSGEMLLRYN